MTMDAIQPLGMHDEVPGTTLTRPSVAAAAEMPFGRVFSEGLAVLNEQLFKSSSS